MNRLSPIGCLGWALFWASQFAALPAAASEADETFFETRIRPVLIQHCYPCHSHETGAAKGGLFLDTSAGVLRGGDSGPAIVPHHPAKSLLVQALRYDGLEMPPDGRLPDTLVRDFETWIENGAWDPRTRPAGSPEEQPSSTPTTTDHWAFRPVEDRPVPRIRDSDWVADEIDAFVLASLEANGLEPAPPADRHTLLRRLFFDLIGLPPAPEDLEAFLGENFSETAWPALVDRLLDSPQFGIHWGRHWLDLARYADSNGGDFNATFHDAWKYRDYVIRSFQADKPFNRFLTEQIAGDLLPAVDDNQRAENLIATGFLMLGTKMLSERDKSKLAMDVADEQLSTIGQAVMGLTVGCARCHDHKFDPISSTDYYALAGILTSTETLRGESQRYVSTWPKRELPASDEHRSRVAAHGRKLADLQAAIKAAKREVEQGQKRLQEHRDGRQLVTVDNTAARLTGNWTASTHLPSFIGADYLHDGRSEKGEKFAEFTLTPPSDGDYDVQLSYTPGENRAGAIPVSIRHAAGEVEVMVDQRPPPEIDGMFASLGCFPFTAQTPAVITIATRNTEGYVIVDAVRLVGREPATKAEAQPANDTAGPPELEATVTAAREGLRMLEADLKRLDQEAPPPLPTALAVADADQIGDCALCIRGEHANRGRLVPRGFLTTVSVNHPPRIDPSQSGRLQLAAWLVDPTHPLTARVYVNRIWHHLIGRGIVASVDNFGIRGDQPSHPELLDSLASRFTAAGWSTKALIRKIVLSSTYRMSSRFDLRSWEHDPENRLLWRANRRRLPAEAIRDAMLSVSGQLDASPGGSPVEGLGTLVSENVSEEKKFHQTASRLRSIYLPIIRAEIPEVLAIFDFADPDVVTGSRPETNVPAQSLFLLNSPFVAEQAAHAATRLKQADHRGSPDGMIRALFQLILARPPTSDEQQDATAFLTAHAAAENATARLIQAVFASTSFRMLE
jgi:hypothetical protein